MPHYDEQEFQIALIDQFIWALGMNRITVGEINLWLIEEFGECLPDVGGLRGFAKHLLKGSDQSLVNDRGENLSLEYFLRWRGGSILAAGGVLRLATEQDNKAIDQGFTDRIAACLRHHGLTMQEAAAQLAGYLGRPLPDIDLRRALHWQEDLSVCRALADMFEVDLRWLILGGEAAAPEWYAGEEVGRG